MILASTIYIPSCCNNWVTTTLLDFVSRKIFLLALFLFFSSLSFFFLLPQTPPTPPSTSHSPVHRSRPIALVPSLSSPIALVSHRSYLFNLSFIGIVVVLCNANTYSSQIVECQMLRRQYFCRQPLQRQILLLVNHCNFSPFINHSLF